MPNTGVDKVEWAVDDGPKYASGQTSVSIQPRPKKSETLEIRLTLEAKTAFMARCHERGRTASEAVRDFIEGELRPTERVNRSRTGQWRTALAAAAAGLAVGAVAAPSLAHPASTPRAAFDRFDRNHDGVLTFEEFRRN
jgi:hypothetical protein